MKAEGCTAYVISRCVPIARQVAPLKTASPLAWRLLGRLRCRCPLYGQSCSWEGDYSELGPHLTSNDTHLANAKGAAAAASADTLNDQANQRYAQVKVLPAVSPAPY